MGFGPATRPSSDRKGRGQQRVQPAKWIQQAGTIPVPKKAEHAPMQAAPPRVDDPASFLTLLHGGEQRGTIFIARKPTVNPEDFRNDPYPVARLDEAAAAIVAWSRDAETYVSVAVFDGGGRERTNIKHLPFLWLDRDEKPFCAALPEPTLTLETSPGRFQDFWQLCEPVPYAAAEDYTRRIADACGCGHQATAGNQVMRVPGTINHGVGKDRPAALVRVTRYLPFALYGIGNFAHLPTASAPAKPVARTDGIVDGMAALRRAVPRLSPRMQACAMGEPITKADGSPYDSESERDMALTMALVRAGLTVSETAAAIRETHRGHMLAGRKGEEDTWKRLLRDATKAQEWLTAQGFKPWNGVPYVRICRAVLERAHILGPEGVAVMVALALHVNRRDEAWPSQGRIAAFLGCSSDLVGDQLKRLRDDLGLLARSGKIGRADRYTLVSMGDDPLCIPRHLLNALAGSGVLPVSIATLVAAQAGMPDASDLTQAQLADRLGIRRERVNPAINRLVDASHLRVVHVGARGVRSYDLSETAIPVVRLSGTNKSHGGGPGGKGELRGEEGRARRQGRAA